MLKYLATGRLEASTARELAVSLDIDSLAETRNRQKMAKAQLWKTP